MIKKLFYRIKKRDFSGSTGLAIKNMSYQFLTSVVAKVGSLIFTVLLARILMPDLFGLYSLALSTLMIFIAISDLGINQTVTRFISKELGRKNKKKAKAYLVYLGKVKIFITSISAILLILSAKLIAENYYQKPLYLALVVGALFIIFSGLFTILKSLFEAINNFKLIFYQEILFQFTRILLIPVALIFILKLLTTESMIVSYVILGISISYLGVLLFYIFNYRKISFFKEKEKTLTKREKSGLKKFILASSLIIFSGAFFSYADRIILGSFVGPEFIGYYTAAFSIIFASSVFLIFSSALLPVFSRLKKDKLEQLYEKTFGVVLRLSLILFLIFLVFAPLIIKIIFGADYAPAVNILRLFSPLPILLPLIALSTTYLIAVGRPMTISKIFVTSTVLNVVLNYILISKLVAFGPLFGVYGAVIATVVSNIFVLSLLILHRKEKKIKKH